MDSSYFNGVGGSGGQGNGLGGGKGGDVSASFNSLAITSSLNNSTFTLTGGAGRQRIILAARAAMAETPR